MCSARFHHSRDLQRPLRYLALNSAKLRANALVSSRLDYCNSFFLILRTLNFSLFRIEWPMMRQSHHPLLVVFHWCISLIGYQITLEFISRSVSWLTKLYDKQTVYFHSMLATLFQSCSLRTNKGITLLVPRVKTKASSRSLYSCAPSLWNNLPLYVRSATSIVIFKKRLKKHLFDLASLPHEHQGARWPVDVSELLY